MIPLESATAILPRMPTGRSITGDFPLTIIKPPIAEVKCRSPSAISSPIYRLLRSRTQRRNSSASSTRSCCSQKAECKQFLPERVDVFELTDNDIRQNIQVDAVLRGHSQSTFTLPENINNYREKSGNSRRANLISSAKERSVSLQDDLFDPTDKDTMQHQAHRLSLVETTQYKNAPVMETKHNDNSLEKEITPNHNCLLEESEQTKDKLNTEILNQSEDFHTTPETKLDEGKSVKETKHIESSSTREQTNKRNTKKSGHSKARKTAKKRRNSVKKSSGITGIFTRLAGSNGHKKHQGQLVTNSKDQAESRTSPHKQSNDNPNKFLKIQKLQATYASKKTENKRNTVLLPKVSSTSLTKENSSCIRSTPSPRKQQQTENVSLISPRPSPRKLLNCDDDKVKKIYLSDAYSGMLTGVPCAPPCTPTTDELKKVEYIPSLTDVKSQRAVKSRLVTLGNKIRAEEQKRKEKAAKEEQKRAYGAILQLKQRQRAEIYALNKLMTELENENFKKFMEEHSAETLPV